MRTEKTLKDEWPMSPAIESYDVFKKALSEDKSDAVGLLATVLKDDDRFRASLSGVIGWTKVYSDGNFVGLALSGGGIRSATFNLGVLQGMARCGLLPYFDYLSTVSGGGYIGSWFAAWLKRKGFTKVCHQLRPEWRGQAGEETPEVQFLRSYSNYLTPQLGLLSADTWSLVVTYVRNLLLNLTILVLGISAVLLLPRLLVVVSNAFYTTPRQLERLPSVSFRHIGTFVTAHGSHVWSNLRIVLEGWPTVYLVLSLFAMGVAIYYAGRNLALFGRKPEEKYPSYSLQRGIQWRIAIPSALSAWFGSCWLWNEEWALRWWRWWEWLAFGSLATFALWSIAWLVSRQMKSKQTAQTSHLGRLCWLPLVGFAPLEGAVGGLILWGVIHLYGYWSLALFPGRDVHFVAWGTGLVAGTFGAMLAIHIGLMGRGFPDERREWWSRTGAFITIYTLGWTAVFVLALYSPLVVLWTRQSIRAAVILGWLAHTLTGVIAARSSKTGGDGSTSGTGLFIKAAPTVFVVGLLALLSFGIYQALPHDTSPPQKPIAVHVDLSWNEDSSSKSTSVSTSVKSDISFHDRAQAYWRSVKTDLRTYNRTLGLILLCGILALLLSSRVDVNEFSSHLLYRNRLVRCYLGASHEGEKHERKPNLFTGFDPDDDLFLAELAQNAPPNGGKIKYTGPYPILNTALNVTHGTRLNWQERKAESFVFTPRFCGYNVMPDHHPPVESKKQKPIEKNGYRPTADYMYPGEGPYLGTAMGISGAAASPNMGYHTSSALAFLMTVFDVRLGWWAGNPRHPETWNKGGPRLGILYLLLELFGSTDDRSRYVYLSDGGHFDNLGIYELVRRGCRLILACDGSEDKQYQFGDLGNAIRKCRIDLGVDISIDVEGLRPKAKGEDPTKWSHLHYAIGIVHYERLDNQKRPGLLIYLKSSLTDDEPPDVLEYKATHPEFPHDTTANQFFGESQFESYRRLGQHVVGDCGENRVLDLIRKPQDWMDRDLDALEKLLKQVTPESNDEVKTPHRRTEAKDKAQFT
jgi:predicted acylesterase/phospholipase RssA